jgi:hypothetical protein
MVLHAQYPDVKYSGLTKLWQDETVFIVGGGPSLAGFDWTMLEGKNVIALNRAIEVVPSAAVLFFTDSQFYSWYREEVDAFHGLKITCKPIREKVEDIIFVKSTSKRGIDLRPEFICHGNNSGYGAINVAFHLGARRIVLLGFDMTSKNGQTHWHDGYPRRHNHNVYLRLHAMFEALQKEALALDLEIVNANPSSELQCFPKIGLEEAMVSIACQ